MKVKQITAVTLLGLGFTLLLLNMLVRSQHAAFAENSNVANTTNAILPPEVDVIVDDFLPQPLQGDPVYYYNRLGGDRGALNNVLLAYGIGQVRITIQSDTWGGMWFSLNHPDREKAPIDFSAVLPAQIQEEYQSQITDLNVKIAESTPNATLRIELKNDASLNWSQTTSLSGGTQVLSYPLSAITDTTNLNFVLEPATAGDYVVINEITLTATNPISDVALAGFVWSYGMLLNNFEPATGLVRDRSNYASGEFEAIQATGGLAAATAVAHQLGIINTNDAITIVNRISDTLLLDVPRYNGLWPHFVEITPSYAITIVANTEYSSVDTAIAVVGLLEAQQALGLDTGGTEQMLNAIDWADLKLVNGISHGYTEDGTRLTSSWDVFGGESWLIDLVYAAATAEIPPLAYPLPPTANGSGFIDEMAWLFYPPPCPNDYWGADWLDYRREAVDNQVHYFCENYPTSCVCQKGLFGLSAGEVPTPSAVAKGQIYQPFGIGGQFSAPSDGVSLLGAPVAVPHYSAMAAPLTSTAAISMWVWLIDEGPFSPLNNIESLMFPADATSCSADELVWNELKGSWNLTLQALGWGRYLAQQRGETPVLWQAMRDNPFLTNGYALIGQECHNFLPVVNKE
ncbi:MAG: hypothetical protein H6667_16005 [Ardenticatenaceae bacterium]|nr:hypothetical protein [Ardenticatenaceae bacterium]MCB9443673.1 hypothetical protein [Ardenticatenaceae bacterium]